MCEHTLLCLYYESDTTSYGYSEYVSIHCFACTMSRIGYNFLWIFGIYGHTLLCLYYESDTTSYGYPEYVSIHCFA